MNNNTAIYAEPPKEAPALEDCSFYHVMELPGIGQVDQEWNLRENVDDHLGNVSFEGKRVLEVGPVSGFLTFHMEERGAEVVSIDLSPQHCWDIVPMEQIDAAGLTREYKE